MTNSTPRLIPGVVYGPEPKGFGPALHVPPRLIVVHDTGNTATAMSEAHYAATRTDPRRDWSSAHAYVDDTTVIGSVPLDMQAWGAYAYANAHGWHLEMCGKNAGDPGAVHPTTLARSAAMVAHWCDWAGIPVRKLSPTEVAAGLFGICGHRDVTLGLHVGTHDDPGSRFDWSTFIAAVKSHSGIPVPTLGGFDMAQLGNLTHGSAGWEVKSLQGMLNAQNATDEHGDRLAEDGNFGAHTEAAVRHFQSAHGLQVDGEAGPHTRCYLNTGHDL